MKTTLSDIQSFPIILETEHIEQKSKQMTLSEAIKHCEEKAKDCSKCAREHKQLAQWLKELKQLRAQLEIIKQENQEKSLINVHNRNANIDRIPEVFQELRLEIARAEMFRQEKVIGIVVSNPENISRGDCLVLTTNYDNLWFYVSISKFPDIVSSFWFDLGLLKEER